EDIAQKDGLELQGIEIIHEANQIKAVEQAVRLVHEGGAQILMKGASSTSILLKAVLNKEWGLRKGSLLSHLSVFELSRYHKLLGITDVAINIAPGVNEKMEIIKNAVGFMQSIGISKPKVALIAAVEKVYNSMPATIEAAEIVRRYQADELVNCLVDGPFALDIAISSESALHKGVQSPVAGDADLLLMPQIESGNILYKSLSLFSDSKIAAVVLGASAPIVLTSRADSEESKLNSIMLAAVGGII
ncbi:MAG: phosphate butyryltransferase, partial [Bacteroidales bacterium]|nr:phosphate butyryltransferase [Bacteroidales bacterium]